MTRKLAITLLAIVSAAGIGPVSGWGSSGSAPDFALTISFGSPDASLPKNTQILIVRKTNLSHEIMRESACTAFGALYKLDVVYNGIPQIEPDEGRKRRELAEAVEAGKPVICDGSVITRPIGTGEHWDDALQFPAEKPGIYEFTVEEKSFPRDGGKPIVVKSNTLTIVVPLDSEN